MQQATTISGDQLAKRLRAREGRPGRQSFLLLDCRPFIAYNVGHVRGAINVNCCDRFNRKRLQQGKASLADLATTKEGKEALKKRNWKEVVVYDDSSEDLSSLPYSHTLFLVINSLLEDGRQPVMLIGGTPGLSDDPVLVVRGPPDAAQPLPDESDGARPASPSLPVRPVCHEGHREPPRQPGHPLPLPRQHEGRQRRHWLDETWGGPRAQRDGGVTDVRHVRDDHLQAAARRGQRLPEPEAVFRGGFRLHRPGTISRGLSPYPARLESVGVPPSRS